MSPKTEYKLLRKMLKLFFYIIFLYYYIYIIKILLSLSGNFLLGQQGWLSVTIVVSKEWHRSTVLTDGTISFFFLFLKSRTSVKSQLFTPNTPNVIWWPPTHYNDFFFFSENRYLVKKASVTSPASPFYSHILTKSKFFPFLTLSIWPSLI